MLHPDARSDGRDETVNTVDNAGDDASDLVGGRSWIGRQIDPQAVPVKRAIGSDGRRHLTWESIGIGRSARLTVPASSPARVSIL